jgi:hypothetical protein
MSALRLVKGAYGRNLGPCMLLYLGRIVQLVKSGCRVVRYGWDQPRSRSSDLDYSSEGK